MPGSRRGGEQAGAREAEEDQDHAFEIPQARPRQQPDEQAEQQKSEAEPEDEAEHGRQCMFLLCSFKARRQAGR